MALAVCADPVYRAPLLEGAVQTDNIMVADGLESHKTVIFGDLGCGSVDSGHSGGTVDDDFVDVSHNDS